MGKVIQNNLNISFEDKILVEVAKDKSFLSRRRDRHMIIRFLQKNV